MRINGTGLIVGDFNGSNKVHHGYLRNLAGMFTIIDHPDASPIGGTFATGLNDAGAVIGYFYDSENACHGFVRK